MYHVRQFSYCGCNVPERPYQDEREARGDVADILRRRRRQGFPVVIIERGKEWEVCEPENCVLVPDQCGIVRIDRVMARCQECGTAWDTADEAAECCTEDC